MDLAEKRATDEAKSAPFRVRPATVPGVFADQVIFMRSEDHFFFSFLQICDVDEDGATLLAQPSAQVYMPLGAVKRFHDKLGKALKRLEEETK